MKREIKEKVDSISLWDFDEVSIQKIIEQLISIRDNYKQYDKIWLETPYEYEGDTTVRVYGIRLETDEEEQKRESEESEFAARDKERRRLKYVELKREFES